MERKEQNQDEITEARTRTAAASALTRVCRCEIPGQVVVALATAAAHHPLAVVHLSFASRQEDVRQTQDCVELAREAQRREVTAAA